MIIDTHCHIYEEYYDDIDDLMKKIKKYNVDKVINNACNLNNCKEVLNMSNKYENMYCVLGLHPEDELDQIDEVLSFIENNLNNYKIIGIGEIGLDYYYSKENKDKQIEVFKKQLDLAQKYSLPVIIHSRESTGDVLSILKNYKLKGIIHCFNGSLEVAREYIKMGFKLGINGVVTFNNCKLIDVINELGVTDLVYETDSPYLTPVPYRGKKNDPSYVNYVVDFICDRLNLKRQELVDISNQNINQIFDI